MKAARIHVVWIRGKTEESDGETATWRFFKTIVRSVSEIQRIISSSHGAIHFKISQRTGSRPEIVWAEHPFNTTKKRPSKK